MRVVDFLINSFQRWSPVASESMASLKDELNRSYNNILNNVESKNQNNDPIQKQMDELAESMSKTDVHTPEFEEQLLKFDGLKRRIEKPTLMERGIMIFEKPLVRLLLMVGFIFLSRWIAKKITEKKEDKEPEEETQPQGQNFYPQYPPQQYYQPYGNNWQPQYPPQGYQNHK